jgi:adenylate cyclase
LLICENGVIDKIRYEVKVGQHIFEVDIFTAENDGLLVAEIELQFEDEVFEKPIWLGKEVTNDERYYNAYLSKKPFTKW